MFDGKLIRWSLGLNNMERANAYDAQSLSFMGVAIIVLSAALPYRVMIQRARITFLDIFENDSGQVWSPMIASPRNQKCTPFNI